MLSALLVLSGVVGWRLFAPLPGDSFAELDRTDRTMLEQLAAEYAATASAPEQVWTTEWRFEEQPLALLRTGGDQSAFWDYAVLVNMSDVMDTGGLPRISVPGHPELKDVVLSKRFGVTDPMNYIPGAFNWMEVDGRSVMALRYNDDLLRGRAASIVGGFQEVAIHEEFHGSAQKSWTYREGEAPYIEDYPLEDAQLDLLRQELAAFDAADGVTDPARLRQIGADIVSIRSERERRWPQLKPQSSLEKMEGTATYVERAAAKLRGAAVPRVDMTDALDTLRKSGALEGLERDVFYDTGARLGMMLDWVAPNWKADITSGSTTPFDVLKEATGVRTPPTSEELSEIAARLRD
ncbi:hypothetical protein [Leucobacter iarius]|uniref:Uncharacterized protein n=1 Tax=Leucobacter iarius TaxID=333963 RepID=A0ABN2LUN2_9MICO